MPDTHVLFEWEKTFRMGNVEKLIDQLCYEVGFPNSDRGFIPRYFTGELSELIDHFPELKYYRDIVFCFKYMMSPTAKAFPPVRPWLQKSARLIWKYMGQKEGFSVRAFSQKLEIDVWLFVFLGWSAES